MFSGFGGGINNSSSGTLTATRITVSGNTANEGGGINNSLDSVFSLADSTMDRNTATLNGGGVYQNAGGNVTLTKSTVSNNTAGRDGGGFWNGFNSTVDLRNSTISGNDSLAGGGVYNSANLTASGLTLSGNVASTGGGIWIDDTGIVDLANTIITNNSGDDCSGTPTSFGFNLDSDGTCGLNAAGDLPNTDPLLGPLQDNGGPTFTQALLPGSPAIDAIPVDGCTDIDGVLLATDQREVVRPQGSGCDIGAFELVLAAVRTEVSGPATGGPNLSSLAVGALAVGILLLLSGGYFLRRSRHKV